MCVWRSGGGARKGRDSHTLAEVEPTSFDEESQTTDEQRLKVKKSREAERA